MSRPCCGNGMRWPRFILCTPAAVVPRLRSDDHVRECGDRYVWLLNYDLGRCLTDKPGNNRRSWGYRSASAPARRKSPRSPCRGGDRGSFPSGLRRCGRWRAADRRRGHVRGRRVVERVGDAGPPRCARQACVAIPGRLRVVVFWARQGRIRCRTTGRTRMLAAMRS